MTDVGPDGRIMMSPDAALWTRCLKCGEVWLSRDTCVACTAVTRPLTAAEQTVGFVGGWQAVEAMDL